MTIELLAMGCGEDQTTTLPLQPNSVVRIGRAPKQGWQVAWDRLISREHADLKWIDGQLQIRCLKKAANPIVRNGEPVRELSIAVGGEFLIGQTTFRLLEKDSAALTSEVDPCDDDTVNELVGYDQEELNAVDFSDPARQMEMLARLPKMISASANDEELAGLLVNVLLQTIPAGVATAVVQYTEDQLRYLQNPDASGFDDFRPAMMRVATRDDYEGRFRPSRRMISSALETGKSILHIWDEEECEGNFTVSGSLDWAFCTPIQTEAIDGWCLYVSGEGGGDGTLVDEQRLKGDLRFVELVAQFIGSIRQVRLLQEQKTQLSSFFSPRIMDSLVGRQITSLAPSQQEVSVLFCDVRGFSKKCELLRDDLFKLLATVKKALGVMANGIVERDGAIADFQGDAALGFWGWPVSLKEGPVPACRAALSIVETFNDALNYDGLLDGFHVGIGIAHGSAIAGEIGTEKHAKIGVFGPVVNQGSRFEGLTKQLGVTICIDETTAEYVRRFMPPTEARSRRLARLRPAGMETPLTVYQLLPPEDRDSTVSSQLLRDYDDALEAIIDGTWNDAMELLIDYRDSDGPTRFLFDQMEKHGYQPPTDWDGAFRLTNK